MTNQILPVLDTEALQKAATEFAMKGAIKSIEEYYSGYNSPFRKAIEEDLKTKSLSGGIELPDLIALINESLSNEIDLIANTAISKTFIPLIKKTLTRRDAEMSFSDLLRNFIEATDAKDIDDCEVAVEKHMSYGWLNVEISHKDKVYKLTLHEDWNTRNEPVKKYKILSLPCEEYSGSNHRKMKLTIEGASLEMPFISDILHDKFNSYIAGVIMAGSKITMDTKSFDEDMFPELCHC